MMYVVRLHFPTSNNMVEYEALLCRLRIAIETGIKRLDVRGDSQLVIDQVLKNASCHDEKMEAYCKAVPPLRINFMALSSTRRQTSSRRSLQGESPFPQTFSVKFSKDLSTPKWIEARPITNLRAEQAVSFFTDLIHWFGVPNSIITDNGSQFTGKKFMGFCDDHHIRVDWAALHIHKLMAKWSVLMACIYKALSPGSSTN
jgi:hypothetical protein